jgi:hypothetical protein
MPIKYFVNTYLLKIYHFERNIVIDINIMIQFEIGRQNEIFSFFHPFDNLVEKQKKQ